MFEKCNRTLSRRRTLIRCLRCPRRFATIDDIVLVEGNNYFPPESLRREYFNASDQHTHCPWKGDASYYDVVVAGASNEGAAWYYPDPKEAAANIKGRVAFWKGVVVQ